MITKVYNDKLLLERLSHENNSKYLIPEDSIHEPLVGTVIHAGDKVLDTPIGSVVVFDEYDHRNIIIEGTIYVLVKEESLICKLKENGKTD